MEGSSEGISEGLLWLWLFSDVLDVVGCSISDTVSSSSNAAMQHMQHMHKHTK
jgi:hypothetical protein